MENVIERSFLALDAPMRRALELAWQSIRAGSLDDAVAGSDLLAVASGLWPELGDYLDEVRALAGTHD